MPAQKPRERKASSSNLPKVSVNTYYGNRGGQFSVHDSPFQKKRVVSASNKLLNKIIDILIVIVLVVCLIYSLLLNSKAKVITNDSTYRINAEYTSFVESRIKSIRNKNKITFDKEQLSKDIKKEYPEVVNVNVELPVLGQKSVIRIGVAKPAFFLSSEGSEYLIASNGVALGYKSNYKNPPSLITITDESGFEVAIGKKILSNKDILFLQTLNAELNRNKVSLKNLVLSRSPQEVNLYIADAKYYTKFFMGGDASLQTGQFLAARNAFKAQAPPSVYLDVRVAGKVYYK